MSQKIAKLSRKIGQSAFDRKVRSTIYLYVGRIVAEPLKVRIAYCWRVLRGRNPHTNKRPEV